MSTPTRRTLLRTFAAVGLFGSASATAGSSIESPSEFGSAPRVEVRVTMDGEPTDAQLVARDADRTVAAVEYTDIADVGRASFVLEPGEYELEVDAGGGHIAEREYREITVDSDGARVSVDVEQRYHPNDRGWYASDPHAHSQFSADGDTPIDRFVVAQLAAALDVVFISDHNDVRGHTPVKEFAQQRGVPYMLGEELTTDIDADDLGDRLRERRTADWGHFNVYPLPENRLVDWTGDPEDFFQDAREAGAEIIQANHPRRDGNYFLRIDDPGYVESFDTAEAYDGGFDSDDAETIQQLFEFWNRGYRYTATSVTDDHHADDLGEEYGTPRTYVYLDDPPSGKSTSYAEAIDRQHAFVSYGPLIYFSAADGSIPGETVEAADGKVTLTAELRSVDALTEATVVRNGDVVSTYTLSGRTATVSYETDISGTTTNWYVVRVRDERGAQGVRAMTNPIYVTTATG